MPPRHAAWITVAPDNGRLIYQTRCSRGWKGPWRNLERLAREDGATHLGDVKPFVRSVNNIPVNARKVF